MKNQLADTSEVNREFDCVPTAIAACLEYLLGHPFDGGAIKDAVYGQAYQGGTAAIKYVQYCQEQGVKLFALDGQPAQLVQDIRFWIGQHLPLIGTEPDPYANQSLGWTHVVAFYGADTPPGTLTCLDPFGGHSVTLSDAEWEKRLQFNQVWKLEKEAIMSGVPQGWRDDGAVLWSPSHYPGGPEVPVKGRIRDYVLANNWHFANVALGESAHTAQLEASHSALGGGWQQTFRWSLLGIPDTGDLAGKVIWEWLGVELDYYIKQCAALEKELLTLESRLDPAKVADRLTALAQLGHQVEALATQVIA